jgi:hypothetical protein
MTKRPRPDIDHVRDAMRDHDDRHELEEDAAPDEPAEPADDETPEDDGAA